MGHPDPDPGKYLIRIIVIVPHINHSTDLALYNIRVFLYNRFLGFLYYRFLGFLYYRFLGFTVPVSLVPATFATVVVQPHCLEMILKKSQIKIPSPHLA